MHTCHCQQGAYHPASALEVFLQAGQQTHQHRPLQALMHPPASRRQLLAANIMPLARTATGGAVHPSPTPAPPAHLGGPIGQLVHAADDARQHHIHAWAGLPP